MINDPKILSQHGNVPVAESYFARMTFTAINATKGDDSGDRIVTVQSLSNGVYETHKIVEHVILAFLATQTGIKLGQAFTQYAENIENGESKYPIFAGPFTGSTTDSGEIVLMSGNYERTNIGMNGIRRFY